MCVIKLQSVHNEQNEKSIGSMILIIKIFIIFLTEITLYKSLPKHLLFLKENSEAYNLDSLLLVICNSTLIYIVFLAISKRNISINRERKLFSWIENLVFIPFLSIAMYLSNSYESEVKYIFLLLIIVSVIQHGLRYGVIITIISSCIILSFDYIFAPTINGINENFESDLIITGVYIFVTWILGYYVEIEKENKKLIGEKISALSNELKESTKSRQEIEKNFMKNEICFNMLFKNSDKAIIVHRNKRIFYANEKAARLLGYSNPEELNKILFSKHYSKEDLKAINSKYVGICNKQLSNVVQEENIIDCFGNSITVRNTSSFIEYEGKAAVVTLLLDIRPEKQIVELKRDVEISEQLLSESRGYNSLITEFFTNISHELKTPINIIYMGIQTMNMYLNTDEGEVSEKCKSYLKMMKQNCFRLIKLVNNLLDVTKLDTGFYKLEKKNNNIVMVVEDIVLSVAKYIESKDIELVFDTSAEEKVMAFDYDKIERIILNLLSNAFKCSSSGGQIAVNIDDRGSSVVISVKDEGVGIPEDKKEFIFERFGQVNRSLSRTSEGTGIGLYIVKSLVEIHEGTISVISTEGKGSEFIIELPVLLIDEDNSEEEQKYESNKPYENKVERINIEFSDIYSIEY